MGFSERQRENAVFGAHITFRVIVTLFFATATAVSLYTIIVGFRWLSDFKDLEGHGTNWKWAVAVIVLSFFGMAGNAAVTRYSSHGLRSNPKESGRLTKVLTIGLASTLLLPPTVTPWYFVRDLSWAAVLREAGHADDAYHVDVYTNFASVAIAVYSTIAAGVLILGLAVLSVRYFQIREIRAIFKRVEREAQNKRGGNEVQQPQVPSERTGGPSGMNQVPDQEDNCGCGVGLD
ncbi:hypothetical protein AYO21_12148 [Fonsecaea monophora]|uniref:Uncharacterized protein n=1 Tax=Fonsecaea monophora TaxID=254056 RepID=A0A177ER40_9EURO|nr:hypothetical protein AYO21_12148 [Fonsecaea monophora]OAG33770.1 hypothetical protein AYO21_12148 [Fonsecaea monophora]